MPQLWPHGFSVADVVFGELDSLECLVPDSFGLEPAGRGHLSQRTFVLKDMIAIAGHTSSYGHPRWRETHSPSASTAPAVNALLADGARMVGLAKLDQLAYSLVGNVGEGVPPRNSLYPDRFAGGSSSGPAAAVVGGAVDFGVGSDTAGSIRVPAAACGLFSLRPTHGALDSTGMLPLAPSFDCLGILAREPVLLEQALSALLPPDSEPSPLTLLSVAPDCVEAVDPDLAAAILAGARSMSDRLGIALDEISLGRFTTQAVADLFARIQAREIWANHADWVLANRDTLASDVRARLERAEGLSRSSAAEQAADHQAWEEYRAAYSRLARPDRAIVLPVTPGLPPLRTAGDEELLAFRQNAFSFTAPSSLTGSPQVVAPVRSERTGLAYGMGLLGMRGGDHSLVRALVAAA